MVLSRWNSFAALALTSAGLAGFSAAAEDEIAPVAEPIEIVAQVAAQEGKPVPVEVAIEPQSLFVVDVADEASPYWIGVQLEPPTDILKQHLNLEGGMVTVHVFEGSPAEKAGLKANDIILKAADIYIKEPGDLLKSVGKAEENELTLVLLRGGKEQTIKVVPAKRPQEGNRQTVIGYDLEGKKVVQRLDAALHAYKGADKTLNVIRLRPGVVTSATLDALKLPKDVAIRITKEGDSPAKIWVRRDAKEWEVTEDKLDKLPEDVRAYLQQFQSGSHAFDFHWDTKVGPQATRFSLKSVEVDPESLVLKRKIEKASELSGYPVPAVKTYEWKINSGESEVDSKLDRILKIVSQKEDSSVSELRKEVQQLRKELESLRQEKK